MSMKRNVDMQSCPFRKGDTVIYKPNIRGVGLGAHTYAAQLIPGEKYTVAAIEKDNYVVVEGFEDRPEGGLYWTEFSAENAT
jgi:hypothetical protein